MFLIFTSLYCQISKYEQQGREDQYDERSLGYCFAFFIRRCKIDIRININVAENDQCSKRIFIYWYIKYYKEDINANI